VAAIRVSAVEHRVKRTVFTVHEWPEVDEQYTHVVLRLPGGYEAKMSSTDAQRLGWRLNDAGGGCLPERRDEPRGSDRERYRRAEAIATAVLAHQRPGRGVTVPEAATLASVVEPLL
jgi:hypothetical protein